MPDWAALRRRAYQQHLKLCPEQLEGADPLVPADAVLAAAQLETGLRVQPLPEGDPLLAGAQAFLDRDSEMIWFASGGALSPERQRFAVAHEFAHFWLHPDVEGDRAIPEDVPATYLAYASSAAAQIEEGYSPQDRREREANVFAAELLLPSPLLRKAVLDDGMRAPDIAALSGLTETCVLTQMAHALLVPAAKEPAATAATAGAGRDSLDPSQRAAAEAVEGPLLVDAGPGTGKTRTLTARIACLVRDRAIPPESILALTFSNRAAEAMTDRLSRILGQAASRVWTGTFHAFGFELLRKEGHCIGLPARPALVETADAIALLEANLDRLDLTEYEYLHNPALPLPDILDAISRAKDELKSPEDYRLAAEAMTGAATTDVELTEAAKAREVAEIYRVYDDLLRAMGLVDYGDLIARSVQLLEQNPDVRARWQRQYPQILADEYQDVNRATARFLQLLAGDGKGLWVVGDLRQAIYRFRGASPANIRQFQSDFPTGRRISLSQNYRSQPGIVRLFQSFASGMDSDGESPGWSPNRAGLSAPAVTVARAGDEAAQADWLAEQIEARVARGVERRDQAILVPTNRQAVEIAGQLEARGVSVRYAGSLFDREEIKDLIALLSLASEPDGLALVRVARFPEIAIPDEDARAVIAAACEADHPFPSALSWALENGPLSDAGRAGLARLVATLVPLVYRGDAWTLLSRYLFETSDYLVPLLREETVRNQQKRLAIYQLLLTLQQMTRQLPIDQRDNPRSALLRRLRRLLMLRQSRSVRVPEAGEAIDGVRIMTVHQSKGLEFPVVYLPNLVKGQFPARGRGSMATLPPALDDAGSADDRQANELFFVALSRAQDELVLSTTAAWRGRPVEPAPLLASIAGALESEGATWVAAEPVSGSCGASSSALASPAGPTVSNDGPPAKAGGGAANVSPATSPGGVTEQVSEARAEVSGRREITLSRLRQYRACPRQYYYLHVLGLPHGTEETEYREFHRQLAATLDWLQAERSAGRRPTAADALAELNARWPAVAPEEESAHRRVLRRRAAPLLARASSRDLPPDRATAPEELIAELEHGAVRMRADEVESAEDRVAVTQYLHRRPKKADHTEESLALLRLAARQRYPDQTVKVALLSTATGDTREVAEDRRWEPGRIEKFEAALEALAQERYPATPSESLCASCPFYFICPT